MSAINNNYYKNNIDNNKNNQSIYNNVNGNLNNSNDNDENDNNRDALSNCLLDSKELINFLSNILIERVDLNKLLFLSPEKKIEKIFQALKKIINQEKIVISEKRILDISRQIYEETFEYGPISIFMKDNSITEIMINDFDKIYVERNGVIEKTEIKFKNRQHLRNLVEKLVSPLGLRIDESCPMVNARLEDGSRINAVIKPISEADTAVTIRKFKNDLLMAEDLLKLGSLNQAMLDFIKSCVAGRINIIISGGTSSGKTTFLNVISNFIPNNERLIVIEETPELNLNIENIIKLTAKQSNIEGKGEITIKELVKNALRMRPDRIIVGEIRGLEAIDILQAMNTGHEGSMTTIHANSPVDLITRLETMLLLSAINFNYDSIKRIILSSVDLIIHLERLADGKRKVAKISELVFSESKRTGQFKEILVKDIFISTNNGYVWTGHKPKFLEKIKGEFKNFDN